MQQILIESNRVDTQTEYPICQAVTHRLTEVLSGNGIIADILGYLQLAKGKMMRPILAEETARLCGGEINQALIDISTGIELVHMASLVHDDVIDNSPTRRGLATLHARYGPSSAVLTGDYLFAAAFDLFTKQEQYHVLSSMTEVIRMMCEGEVDQLLNPSLTEDFYWYYIYRKTSCLIGASCAAGAKVAGANPELVEDLTTFGTYLGYAFQITDDLLDYQGDSEEMGKPAGIDFSEGIWTLPLIRAYQHGLIEPESLATFNWDELCSRLQDWGIIEEVYQEACRYIDEAKQILQRFPKNPHRENLHYLAEFILQRKA